MKSFSVGDGDMFYIRHGADSFTMIDCCIENYNRRRILGELKTQSADKGIVRFISTHPDDDHIRGLVYLHEAMNLVNFYCVKNNATKPESTDDFEEYRAFRNDPKKTFYLERGCSRKWLNESDNERGGAGLDILWPDTRNARYREALTAAGDGGSANNISPIIMYRLQDGATILWMGDLEADFMDELDTIPVSDAHILFAPHHGRDRGKVPAAWLEKINPKLVIIGEAPAEHLNYYAGYKTITQNSAGDITLECGSGKRRIYVSEQDYEVDFLDDEGISDNKGFYIGTLII